MLSPDDARSVTAPDAAVSVTAPNAGIFVTTLVYLIITQNKFSDDCVCVETLV